MNKKIPNKVLFFIFYYDILLINYTVTITESM